MKILHISGFLEYNYGGAEYVTRSYINHLKEQHDVLCYDGGNNKINNIHTFRVPTFFKEDKMFSEWFKRFVIFYPSNLETNRVCSWTLKNTHCKFDLIHCHDIHWISIASKLSTIFKSPLIVTVHENLPQSLAGTGPLVFLANYLLKKHNIIRKKFLKTAQHICVPSRYSCDKADRFVNYQTPTTVVHNWIGDDLLNHKNSSIKSKKLIYVGRLSQEKGLDILLKAIEKLPELTITIIGKGPLESKIKNHKQVEWIPFIQRNDFLKIVQQHEVGVIPSVVDYEAFSLTALEYRYLGLKIVYRKSSAVEEITNDYSNGFGCNMNNVDDLKESINVSLNKPSYVDTNREHFIEKYNMLKSFKIYERLYYEHTNN